MRLICILLILIFSIPAHSESTSIADRVELRDFPSVFQAWNPVDMPAKFPLDTLEERLAAGALHDLIWEEPISQISFNTPLVLGVVWDGAHGGESLAFTRDTLAQALENRKKLLEINPNMVFLMEIRWRDAPGSHLPEDSDWWMRNEDGSRAEGWKGGPEPYYMLNYENPGFQEQVAKQARVAVDSGVYDGVMLDWSGHIDVVKKVRKALGEEPIIIVNIHASIEDGEKYKDYINGSFMECDPDGVRKSQGLCTWENMAAAVQFFETELRSPQINALEVWGLRDNLASMRAATTLALTHSDAYVLFADPNNLPTPDHLHDWYDFWDVDLGRPRSELETMQNGAFRRRFENGVAVYNPESNGPVTVSFKKVRVRASDGTKGMKFELNAPDGDIFLFTK